MNSKSNMNKILGILIVLFVLFSTTKGITIPQTTPYEKEFNNEFTHSVFAEYGTAPGCYYCKFAHGALKNIYAAGWFPFYYVSLVDVNKHAWDRISEEYNIWGWPTVYFDGGYEVVVGSTESIPLDMDLYNMSIVNCSSRVVSDLYTNLTTDWIGNATMNITLSIRNNETNSYDGYLRVYVTEILSTMGWFDTDGNPYTFAFLDYAFDEQIHINGEETWYKSTNWNGYDHDDGYGNNFGSITPDNIMIITAIFNDTSHQGYSKPPDEYPFNAYYVEEITASGFDVPPPPELEIDNITGSFGGIGKGGIVSAEINNIGDIEATNVEWNITVTGGIIQRINITREGRIESLEANEYITISTNTPIRGFGKIEITARADIVSKRATGFIIGPFIFLQ